jgi:hypothetical protein
MRTIYKFIINPGSITLPLPSGAKFLSVNTQGDSPVMWFEVDTKQPLETRHFVAFGTGFEIPEEFQGTYLGTFLLNMGMLVFHLYEVATIKTVVE